MASHGDSLVEAKVAAGAPEAGLTVDMVKAGLEASDEGLSLGEQAAPINHEVFYPMLSNLGKPNSLCISSSRE
jgi:hypothetical protein